MPRRLIPFSAIIKDDSKSERVNYDSVHRVLDVVRDTRNSVKQIWLMGDDEYSYEQKAIMAAEVKQQTVDYVSDIKMSAATMRKLLLSIEEPKNSDIARTIFYTLFGAPNASFYAAIKSSATDVSIVEPDDNGDIDIYGLKFAKRTKFSA